MYLVHPWCYLASNEQKYCQSYLFICQGLKLISFDMNNSILMRVNYCMNEGLSSKLPFLEHITDIQTICSARLLHIKYLKYKILLRYFYQYALYLSHK